MLGSSASVRGAKAKVVGQWFENILSVACTRQGIAFEQIPSGCKWVGKKAIPAKTPFDFIASRDSRAVLFDAKTVAGKTFSSSACKEHQVESLYRFELSGLTAGYIVWFREVDSIVFFRASALKKLPPRRSLKISDGVFLGSKDALNLGVLFNG